MRSTKAVSLGLLIALGLVGLALAQEEKGAKNDEVEKARLRAMIDDLGSDSFDVREKAMAGLREAKDKALPLLEEAAKSEDAEIRWRASALLREIKEGVSGQKEGEGVVDLSDEIDRMFERFSGGRRLRLRRFFDEEDFERMFGRDEDLDEIRKGMEEQEKTLRRFLFGDRDGKGNPFGLDLQIQGRGLRVSGKPDGTIQIERLENGKWVPFWKLPAKEDVVYGLALRPPTEALRAQLDLERETGFVVSSVVEDGAAARAGIQKYDVIVSVNGEKIGAPGSLQKKISATPEGKDAKIRLIRKTKPIEIDLPVQKTRKF